MNIPFYVFIIICGIVLPFVILMYIFREKYVVWRGYQKRYIEVFHQHPEQREKILNSMKKSVSIFRFYLYLSPFYLIFAPWAMSKYAGFNGIAVFICMALVFIINVFAYLYAKWLYQYLTKLDLT